MHPAARERFHELVGWIEKARLRLEGHGASVYDRPELNPGYEQLQHHLDRALNHVRHAEHWAEEMNWIIGREL